MRPSKRKNNQLRPVSIETTVLKHAEGSCLIKCGDTEVICSATVENGVPAFLRGQRKGWITAEYGMLPRSTDQRIKRQLSIDKVSGRTQEIQRLIGRAMRAAVDLTALGERQIIIDCDVVNADGGTRTSAITGGYVALCLAIQSMLKKKMLLRNPIVSQIAAISCGIYNNQVMVDLDNLEDNEADVDANFIFSSDGNLIEIQATAERRSFVYQQLMEMLSLAEKATHLLFQVQNQVLE